MRTLKSLKNIIITFVLQVVSILIAFFTRQYFIIGLGTSYLGLNGVFENVLSMLSLAELGFSTAFTFVLFKPIADNDFHQLKVLMKYFKKIYIRVGMIIFGLGLCAIPLLEVLSKTEFDFWHVVIYYIIYLTAICMTYLFSYQKTLMMAYQDKYITSIISYSLFVLLNLGQVIILYFTKNYALFLLALLTTNLLEGLIVNSVTKKRYPFMKEQVEGEVATEDKKIIKKNVKALFIHRIGGVVLSGTDNMIIATFIGLIQVGFYANYQMVISAINVILGQAFRGITASIGNLSTTNDKTRLYEVYCVGFYINAFVDIAITIILWFVINDFITIWIGAQFILDDFVIICFLSVFFANTTRWMTISYRDSLGLYWHDRYKPIVESIINLIVSIILAQKIGLAGVFIGTLVSTLTTSFWVEPYVLYKHGFGVKLREYFKKYVFYLAIGIVCFGAVFFVDSFVVLPLSLLSIVVKTMLYFIIIFLLFILITLKTDELAEIKHIFFEVLLKKLKRT